MDFKTHLFEYRHEGQTWTIEVKARDPEDARERMCKLADSKYLGTLQAKIPVKFGVFVRLVCWWKNRGRGL